MPKAAAGAAGGLLEPRQGCVVRGILAVVPRETFGDEDLAEGTSVRQEHGSDEASVAVAGLREDGDGLAESELGSSLSGAAVEGLAGFRAIDAVKADADLAALVQDSECVAVGDGDDTGLEGLRQGQLSLEEEDEKNGRGHEVYFFAIRGLRGLAGAGPEGGKRTRPRKRRQIISCS